jgi:hypothetical protein
MIVYVCVHCRQELYKEGEEEKQCESHPGAPADIVHLPDQSVEGEE